MAGWTRCWRMWGDTVRQGQVLARMHSHEVHEVRAAYRQAEAELDRARPRSCMQSGCEPGGAAFGD